MILLRIGPKGKERPAILDKNGTIRDISSIVEDLNPFFLNFNLIEKLSKSNFESLNKISAKERIGPCISYGSIRDKEIIKFANQTGTVLLFSKTRHFKH